MGKLSIFQRETNQILGSSQYRQDSWSLSHDVHQSSQNMQYYHPQQPHELCNLPPQKRARTQLENPMNQAFRPPKQQLFSFQPKNLNSNNLPPLNHPHPQVVFSHSMLPPLNHTYNPQSPVGPVSSVRANWAPVGQGHAAAVSSNSGTFIQLPNFTAEKTSLNLQIGTLPPLPSGLSLDQLLTPGSALQNLLNIITSQSSIKQTTATSTLQKEIVTLQKEIVTLTVEEKNPPLGLEFDPALLKVRHESVISALYSDLPRQCSTCGTRFRSREDHSSHMDWHKRKNREKKDKKQRHSRKWYPSFSMWLNCAVESNTEAVIPWFCRTETVVEKRVQGFDELAVPADYDQKGCALCEEPFEDFWSHEADDWMYKGVVYMNVPFGPTAGMDRSQLGPIAHAKCMPESKMVCRH